MQEEPRYELTSLGHRILDHWREQRPKMCAELRKKGLLVKLVHQAQERASDLEWELIHKKGFDPLGALELAKQDWLLPSEKDVPNLDPEQMPKAMPSESAPPVPKTTGSPTTTR